MIDITALQNLGEACSSDADPSPHLRQIDVANLSSSEALTLSLRLTQSCLGSKNLQALEKVSNHFADLETAKFAWSRAFMFCCFHNGNEEFFPKVIQFKAFQGLRNIRDEFKNKKVLSKQSNEILEAFLFRPPGFYKSIPIDDSIPVGDSLGKFSQHSGIELILHLDRIYRTVQVFKDARPDLPQDEVPSVKSIEHVKNFFSKYNCEERPEILKQIDVWSVFCETQQLKKIAKDDPVEKKQVFKI